VRQWVAAGEPRARSGPHNGPIIKGRWSSIELGGLTQPLVNGVGRGIGQAHLHDQAQALGQGDVPSRSMPPCSPR